MSCSRPQQTFRRAMCSLGVLMILCGCSGNRLLNSENHDAFAKSLAAMVASAPASDKDALKKDGDFFTSAYFKGTPNKDFPDWHAVDQMDRQEFRHFVSSLRAQVAPPVPTPAAEPRIELTRNYLGTLQLQHDILVEKRDRAHMLNHYTVDQFDWAQPFFTPPESSDTVLNSMATFQMNFTNNTAFMVSPPTMHLTLTDPASGTMLFDEDLQVLTIAGKPIDKNDLSGEGEAMIKSHTPTLITYVCCQLITRPTANRLMQNLPKGVEFSYKLAAILDYTQQDQLEHSIYTEHENIALINANRCMADIKAKEATWTPAMAVPACGQ